jgi:hypothetical protein
LNEVLTAVPSGPEGDANGDGQVSATRDEFVEIVNTSQEPVLVERFAVYKEDAERTRIKAACLQAGQALVIFGGIGDGAALPVIPGVVVEISDKSFGFRKEGNLVRVVDAQDVEVIRADLPPSDGESLTLKIQLDAASEFVGHKRFGAGPFSPGTCPGGTALVNGCPDEVVDVDVGDSGDAGDTGPDLPAGCEGGRGVIAGGLGFVAVSYVAHCLFGLGPWPCQREERAEL